MLNKAKKYIDYLDNVKSKLSEVNLDTSKVDNLIKEIKNSELIVPVVGAFSSGKSTLINSFLGESILPTGITPETSLATEIRYSLNNHIEAIKEDGTRETYKYEDMENIKEKASEYRYLELYINNRNIKEIEPLVLVDMPGFDSPVELHNKAILTYLKRGVYFIILSSAEDGGISKSIMREIENITTFGKGFSFCLSKTNLRPEQQVQEVSQRIKEQLEDELDIKQDIVLLDDQGGENLKRILHSIDPEELFEKLFKDRLKSLYFQIESTINVNISTLNRTKGEAKEAIEELHDSIEAIKKKKDEMINDIESRYGSQSIESIVKAITNELRTHKSSLVNLAISNQEAFKSEMNYLIKNRLVYEVKNRMENISQDIINDLNMELKSFTSSLENFSLDENWVDNMTNDIMKTIESTRETVNKINEWTNGQKGKIFKTISSVLAILTNVINPILELVIVFLPNILEFSKEANAREELSNKFESEIIPSLSSKLRAMLPNLINKEVEKMIESISLQFEEELKVKQNEISSALSEKEKDIFDVKKNIMMLEDIRNEIQALTTQILYGKEKIK
jgi:hypothetical protein